MNALAKNWMRVFYNATFVVLILTLIPEVAGGGTDFGACFAEIQKGTWGLAGGTDDHGNPVAEVKNAIGITYDLCIKACGSGSAPFDWSVASQQFGTWVLPWLALLSQLPYGTHNTRDNLLSIVLTVGSPTLAAYSLAFTVLNERWVARRFSGFNTPKARNIARALAGLQQAPVRIAQDETLLAALVTLHENDRWWIELIIWLRSTRTWTISAGSSVTWVIVSYLFTVIDTLRLLGDVTTYLSVQAQAIGAAWLWLLPVVVAWLQLSPKCDSPYPAAFKKLNERHAYIAQESSEPALAYSVGPGGAQYALSIKTGISFQPDELRTGPIFNYARFSCWDEMAEAIAEMVQATSETQTLERDEVEDHRSVSDSNVAFIPTSRPRWGLGFRNRFMLASGLAVFLQWGTTSGGIIASWLAPTQGLGCRSGSLLLYGALSTLVWIMLVLSTFLARFSHLNSRRRLSVRIARMLSVALRSLGKITAFCNAVWIVLACVFQVTGFYDRCSCNSSYLGLRSKAYVTITYTQHDILTVKVVSVIGTAISVGSAFLFWVFICYSRVYQRSS